jgi:hypothetical protein
MWLVSTLGELVRGRCRATNLCDYCAKLAAVENAELLWLDAMSNVAPSLWIILTTRSATLDMSVFYRAHEKLVKALRRRFPGLAWARLLEFTTGYGLNSGGKRRPHWNMFVKHVPATEEAIATVSQVVEEVWCPRVDARIEGQAVVPVEEMKGLTRYVAMHFQKESQSPPDGFRGHRFTHSRGRRPYFSVDMPTAREEARDSLFEGRAAWKAARLGLEGDDAEDFVDQEWERRITSRWGIYFESRKPAPLTDRERANRDINVPVRQLEAAFRWQDEQRLIEEAHEART